MNQRGFSLLEVLVTMVVVSIGLLGLAGLTAASLKNNQSAYQRSIASWQAYDILDRMRANRTQAQNGVYTIDIGTNSAGSGVAKTDLENWKQLLAASMPEGDGSVKLKNGVFEIVVQWNDTRGLGTLKAGGYVGNTVQTFTLNTRL